MERPCKLMAEHNGELRSTQEGDRGNGKMILKPELVSGCLTQERINGKGKVVDGIMLHTIKKCGGVEV
jgi:hypothetical protein